MFQLYIYIRRLEATRVIDATSLRLPAIEKLISNQLSVISIYSNCTPLPPPETVMNSASYLTLCITVIIYLIRERVRASE